MGASPIMSLGVKAMAANFAALQATGHNIANANVDGYSRQSALLATTPGQFTGAGFFGRGVNVTSITRQHDEFLTREASSTKALAAMDGARLEQLQRLEGVFQSGESGLGYSATQLFNAMVDLASQPADGATRQVVLARASDLAQRFNEAGTSLDTAQNGVTADLKASVDSINKLSTGIAEVNKRIAALNGLGQPPNDLLDERDRLISQLAEQVQVTRVDAGDGTVGVFVGGGQRLVLGTEAVQLSVVQDSQDASRSAIAITDGGRPRALDPGGLGGGKLAGLLRFQNEDLVDGRNLVGQLAAAVGGALNAQQLRGITLQPPLGQAQGMAMFAVGAPLARPNAGNAKDASGNPIGSVTLTVTDPAALKASDYEVRESPVSPGQWLVTRLSDNTQSTINSGDTVDGVQIDVANAQSGDRFLLQPVGRAANGMANLLGDVRDIAAASTLVATTGASNTGTSAVASLVVHSVPLPYPAQSDTVTFNRLVPPVNGYDYTYTSSLSGTPVPWRTGLPVQGGNGYTLQITGVPADGDTVVVDPTPASAVATNNGNALALLALRDATVVGGRTSSDAWSQALADVGVRVQSAQSSSDIATAVAQQAEQSRSSQAGVNLDEEAARLIQYQQSYQAAAKVLQVAQSLFDTLLQTAAR